MKITIDTRDDKHEIKHLLAMLRAILEENPTTNLSSGNIFDSSSPSLGTYDTNTSSLPAPSADLFSMFDQQPIANAGESKDNKKDFIDRLQLY